MEGQRRPQWQILVLQRRMANGNAGVCAQRWEVQASCSEDVFVLPNGRPAVCRMQRAWVLEQVCSAWCYRGRRTGSGPQSRKAGRRFRNSEDTGEVGSERM